MRRLRAVVNALPTAPGGGLSVLLGLLGGWRRQGVDFDVVLLTSRPETTRALEQAGWGGQVRQLSLGRGYRAYAWQRRHLPALLAECGADVLLTSNGRIPRAPCPQVVHHHTLFSLCAPGAWSTFVRGVELTNHHLIEVRANGRIRTAALLRGVVSPQMISACRDGARLAILSRGARCALRSADANVFVSDYLRRQAEHLVPASRPRNHVIYNAPGPDMSPGVAPSALADMRRRCWPELATRLCAVQSPDAHKDTASLLEALALLRRVRPHQAWRLRVAGLDSRSFWGDRARRLGIHEQVEWLGGLDGSRVAELYRTSGCLIFPSIFEAFGLPVVEAMRCGCPVIAVDATAVPEIAGGAALLVPPRCPQRIAEAVQRLADDPALAGELSTRGWERSQAFSWDVSAARLARLFEDLARGAKAPTGVGTRQD